MVFIEVKSLAGTNYIRAASVVAVQYVEPKKCTVVLGTGVLLQCTEAAKDVADRIEAVIAAEAASPPTN
ncbi:hypothetical protein PY365_21945 [Roseiarcaceae bacterium H3SJ34-1]|uniref:hypothetical protein n=1 Tax=Terripilifer ovatus TaxID=3032367 RepID=UPI003AB9BBC3|nr:hypothetical protein [Roseiarcaceae bacterium H3SJ34-1]